MKFSFLTITAIAASASMTAAEITIVAPWAETVWNAGGRGTITWKTTQAESKLKCDIQMLNGNATNSNMVASVTNPATPVDCSDEAFEIYPLNDFASGDYWVRVGQIATNTWAYSGVFKFVGNGTAKPYSLASGATPVGAVASTPSSASRTAKETTAGNSTAAAQSEIHDEGAAGHLSVQGSKLVAVAGCAIAAAVALAI